MFCTNLHNNRISRLANNTPIPTYWDSRTWDQGIPIWRYIDTFQQNSLSIHIQITRFILVQLHDKKGIICGIGGEFYRYFILNRDSDSKKYIGISNSQSILDIAKFNLNLYRIPTDLHYVDYNTFNLDSILQEREREQEQDINLCLVNLSTIPLNLFRQLAMSNIRSIILIVCNQKVFNKRRSILESKYDLIDFTHLSSSDTTYVSVYVYSIHKTKRL